MFSAAPPESGSAPLSPFRSFLMGGFESSSHRRADGQRLDIIGHSRHDRLAEIDYAILARHGISTVRDALRWHLIEAEPGRYDWSSWLPMLEAAARANVQVIWDLCHYGIPDWADLEAPDFGSRFACYCAAAAEIAVAHARRTGSAEPPIYCVINEISYWAYAMDQGHMGLRPMGGGMALKRLLVHAAIIAIDAIRRVQPTARFLQPEPLIHVAPVDPEDLDAVREAERHRLRQFETFDMLCGRLAPELGGTIAHLDLPGANFYCDNQWFHEGGTIPFGLRAYRPLGDMLDELHARYGRPVVISETGAEGSNGAAWLRHVAEEARSVIARGVPLDGLCLYPVADYPGWANARHCRCGLIVSAEDWSSRQPDAAIAHALDQQRALGFGATQSPQADLARAA